MEMLFHGQPQFGDIGADEVTDPVEIRTVLAEMDGEDLSVGILSVQIDTGNLEFVLLNFSSDCHAIVAHNRIDRGLASHIVVPVDEAILFDHTVLLEIGDVRTDRRAT